MNVLFTICGRAGSKGIKNKNIRTFLDRPLPLYTVSAIDLFLRQNPSIKGDIVLNTDSTELNEIVRSNKMRKVHFVARKERLAGDLVSKLDVIQDCLVEMEKAGRNYDMIVDMDITSPLRQDGDLQKVIEIKSNSDCDVVFTVTECRRNPYFNMVMKTEEGYYSKVIASQFTARQQAPDIYDMNASIYAYSPMFLKECSNIFEGKCGISVMQDTGILDLDHENDFELMEVIAAYLFERKSSFSLIHDNIK